VTKLCKPIAMNPANRFIFRLATGRNVLLAAGAFLVMASVIMPAAGKDILRLSQGVPPLDLLIWYSPETAFQSIEAYGPEGRGLYRFIQLTADVVYPIIYTVFFMLLLGWLLIKQRGGMPALVVFVPLAIFFFDMLENGCIVAMLTAFPKTFYGVAVLSGAATFLKWASVLATSLLALGLFLKWKFGQSIPSKTKTVREV